MSAHRLRRTTIGALATTMILVPGLASAAALSPPVGGFLRVNVDAAGKVILLSRLEDLSGDGARVVFQGLDGLYYRDRSTRTTTSLTTRFSGQAPAAISPNGAVTAFTAGGQA